MSADSSEWRTAEVGDSRRYLFRTPSGGVPVEIALAAAVRIAYECINVDAVDAPLEALPPYLDIEVEVSLTGAVPQAPDDAVIDLWSPLFAAILLRDSTALTALLMFHTKFGRRLCAAAAEAGGAAHITVGDDSRFLLVASSVEDSPHYAAIARAVVPLLELMLQAPPSVQEWLANSLAAAVTAVHMETGLGSPKVKRGSGVGASRRPMLFVDAEALRALCESSASTVSKLQQQLPVGLVVPVRFVDGDASILGASLAVEWQNGAALHFYAEALPFLEHVPIHSALSAPERLCIGHIAAMQRLLLSTASTQDFASSVGGMYKVLAHPPPSVVCLFAAAHVARSIDLADSRGHLFLSKVEQLLSAQPTVDYFATTPSSRAAVFDELWLPAVRAEDRVRKFRTRVEMLHEAAVKDVTHIRGAVDSMAWCAVFNGFFLGLMPVVEELRTAASGRQQEGDKDEALDEDTVLTAVCSIVGTMNKKRSFKELPLEEKFEEAQQRFGAVAGKYDNNVKLRFYGLFKQATIGDVNVSKPWAIDMAARAKYDAWAALKGVGKDEAMRRYVAAYVETCAGGVEPNA